MLKVQCMYMQLRIFGRLYSLVILYIHRSSGWLTNTAFVSADYAFAFLQGFVSGLTGVITQPYKGKG